VEAAKYASTESNVVSASCAAAAGFVCMVEDATHAASAVAA
jgi:hypothetical protein